MYHPEAYDRSRPLYPEALFRPLLPCLGQQLPDRLDILDLGCGTGLAWGSLDRLLDRMDVTVTLMDPNQDLLNAALKKFPSAKAILSAAEKTPLKDESQDLVLVGSAWHWFDSSAIQEVNRILKPGGTLYVFEYQFPKLVSDQKGLNEWIRRQFNEVWRFEGQRPRGSLAEVTAPVRNHPSFAQKAAEFLIAEQKHSPEFFVEIIFSQARYLDFERKLKKENVLDVRTSIFESVQKSFSAAEEAFQYRFEGFLFQKRRV